MIDTTRCLPPKSDYFKDVLDTNNALRWKLTPPMPPYIPHSPTPKQLLFLMLSPYREAFYGGAAGGGKSDALLMAALQYVDNPYYNAIIFRKTFADLRLASALINRSLSWLRDTDARWNGSDHCWTFPSGATLAFGYLDSMMDHFRYQSAEFQYIAFDELTQHNKEDYEYMFSRLRRTVCSTHQVDAGGVPIFFPESCQECRLKSAIPLRVRAASNPGGIGHLWVKQRYVIKKDPSSNLYLGAHPRRPYIPAFIWDNPHVDQQEYIESLSELDPVTREQLLRGDWGVTADGRFKREWMHYYSRSGRYIILGLNQSGAVIDPKDCQFFTTVDPAASIREGPGDASIWRREPSFTVICTWCLTPQYDLLLWSMRRFHKEIPDVVKEIVAEFEERRAEDCSPSSVIIEVNGLGIGIYQSVLRTGLPVRAMRSAGDKLVRATDISNRMEAGKVRIPQMDSDEGWVADVESELFTWVGHPQQTADIVDNFSMAGIHVSKSLSAMSTIRSRNDLPSAQ